MLKNTLLGLLLGILAFSAAGIVAADDRTWVDRLEYVGVAVHEPGYHVWGSSPVIGPEGKTHLFVSRWPITKGFGAWLTDCEIARYVSDSPEGPFVFHEAVVTGTGQDSWDRQSPHNPNVQKVGDQYVLTYIANAGGERRKRVASQCIGMMVADDPAGPWRKTNGNGLILSPPADPAIWSHNSVVGVNNPALFVHPDGRFFLYYKAMKKGDVRRMGVAIADRVEGPYVFLKDPLTSNKSTIEDGYAFFEDGKVYLLTTHNEAGTGYLWASDDGIRFDTPVLGFETISHYLPAEVLRDATTFRGGKFERPQVLLRNGVPSHLYVASGMNLAGGDGTHSCVLRIHEPKN
ncbi:glycoside hydrolase family protein [Planctomycetota bacterium]